MKVIENTKDRFGRYPIVFKNATLSQIHEWLYRNYQGFKFAFVFDETKDSFEPMGEIRVYFLDTIQGEVEEYCR